ncbi:MAG: DUF4176 domain-containing protein [Lachnospiraceae bacterium]|nr:DUF4176 domain-containing protein [Lachnospiraceae bacterium]
MAEEKSEFPPLGSIVLLNGSVKKLMVLARGSVKKKTVRAAKRSKIKHRK